MLFLGPKTLGSGFLGSIVPCVLEDSKGGLIESANISAKNVLVRTYSPAFDAIFSVFFILVLLLLLYCYFFLSIAVVIIYIIIIIITIIIITIIIFLQYYHYHYYYYYYYYCQYSTAHHISVTRTNILSL